MIDRGDNVLNKHLEDYCSKVKAPTINTEEYSISPDKIMEYLTSTICLLRKKR